MKRLFLIPNLDQGLAHIKRAIAARRQDAPLAPARLLLPTGRSGRYAQATLGRSLNITFDPFIPLAQAILSASPRPVRRLDDTGRRQLIRQLLSELADTGELTTFTPIYQKPGFVGALSEWLNEMKSQGIRPEQVAAEAAQSGLARDQQLAALFSRYQRFLQERELADNDGLLWLAVDQLEQHSELFCGEAPLFVLGFDQFNPTQLRLLGALGERVDLTIYLLWDEKRPDEDLVLTRLLETRRALAARLSLTAASLPDDTATQPAAALRFLRGHLLREEIGRESPPEPAGLQAVAAPSREAEVRWLLRDIKRRLLDGADPSEIAILAPTPSLYRRLLSTIASEYELPIQVAEPLKLNPAVAGLLNLVGLAPDFPWRLTMECLRSPYVAQQGLDDEQLGLLAQLTRERPVVAGVDQWRFALRHLDLDLEEREDEDLGPLPLVAKLPAETLAAIEAGLLAFFNLVSPPLWDTYHNYVAWLEQNILWPDDEGNSLALLSCLELEPSTAERDKAAMALVLGRLRALLAAVELTGQASKQISWDSFRGALQELLPEAAGPEANGIFVGALEEGRSMQVEQLYVLGLSEGEFPRPVSADIFYDPQERTTHPLPLVRHQPAESATLWWQLLACPRTGLTLLRPRIDEGGALWVPSPYWEATLAALPGFPLLEPALAPLPEVAAAARPAEWLNGLAAAAAPAAPQEYAAIWSAAQRGLALHEQRHSWQPTGPFEGLINADDITGELAERYGEAHHWSASRLNRYGLCPYGFYAQHILKLAELADPEEGFNAMQRGSLLHAILEKLFQRLTAAGLAPAPENEAQILAWLEDTCDELFASAPLRYGFRESSLWRYEQGELRRLLERLLRWECSGEGYKGHEPLFQELRFGFPDDELPPLKISVGEITFKLHGVIDRIDRDAAGALHILDYKSGRTTYSANDIAAGRSLQVVLYRQAAAELLPQKLAEPVQVQSSQYLHLPNRQTSGQPGSASKLAELNETALQKATEIVAGVRAGHFPAAPSKTEGDSACRPNCPFAPLCRVTRTSLSKWRGGI